MYVFLFIFLNLLKNCINFEKLGTIFTCKNYRKPSFFNYGSHGNLHPAVRVAVPCDFVRELCRNRYGFLGERCRAGQKRCDACMRLR